jgi:xyloglucan-specific exo-beta-1,4-glucanase
LLTSARVNPNTGAAVSTGKVMLSKDDGESWQWAAAQPAGEEVRTGTLAVAAGDPKVMAAIAENQRLYWTEDGGATWRSASVPGRAAGTQTLEADRVEAKTFYWYDHTLGFLASTDGGATWSVRCDGDNLPARSVMQLAVDFRRAGHLLACWGSGDNGGVIRSTDGGQSWSRLDGFDQGWVCAIGKERLDDGPSTLYVRGIYRGQVGIWRSTDGGGTWQRIVAHPRGIYHRGEHLWADWDKFGVVYIALRGNGFAYGQPVTVKPTTQ